MTISADYAPNIDLGNGATVTFAVNFPFGAKADLKVTLNTIATGLDISPAPVLNGAATYDYSVAGTPDPDTGIYPNGTVTFNTAPPSTLKVVRERITPQRQNTSLTNNGPFPAKTVEGTFDREEMQLQEAGSLLTRALHASAAVQPNSMELPGDWFAGTAMFAYDAVLKKPTTAAALAYLVSVIPSLTLSVISAAATAFFPTTASLLSAFTAPTVLPNGMTVQTGARAASGDNGGALFRYNSADVATADNAGTIRVDGAGRRWYAVIQEIAVRAEIFGASTASGDNTTAINKAFIGAALLGKSVTFGSGGTFICTGQLTYDMSLTSMDLNGATLDFSSIGAATAIVPFTTWTDPNSMTGVHSMRPFRNGRIKGPSGTGKCFLGTASTISAQLWLSGGVFENLQIEGFQVFYTLISGNAVGLTFRNVYFGATVASSSGWFLALNGATNTGENIILDHCYAINCTGLVIDLSANANVDVNCVACSVDNVTYIATGGTLGSPGSAGYGSKITFLGGHWETVQYTQYLIWTAANGQAVSFGVQQVLPASVTHTPFKSDGTQLTTGIVLNSHNFVTAGGTWPSAQICDGSGHFEISAKAGGNTFLVNASISSNRVPSYTFPTSGSFTSNWTGTPVYNGNVPSGAVGSAALSAANPTTSFTTPCNPGQKAACQAQVQWVGLGAGDTLTLKLDYLDKGGNVLGTASLVRSAVIAAFAIQDCAMQALAPAGTVNAKMTLTYTPSGGGATAYLALPFLVVD